MMNGYVEGIKNAAVTIFDGMAVTFSHLFRTPITVQYPDKTPEPVRDSLPDRYRGHLDVDMEICISCRICEKECPIDCIKIEDVRIPKDTVTAVSGKETARVKEATRFDILMYKCMYCGLCVEPCPTGAIHFTKEFEGSTRDIGSLHYRYVDGERKARVLAKGERYAIEQAEAQKKKEEEKARKALEKEELERKERETGPTSDPPENGGEEKEQES